VKSQNNLSNPNIIVRTADGSNTIFNSQVGENYHSKHGALQESRHVFVKMGLEYYSEKNQTASVSILEVGFGTGLNFLLSADFCTERQTNLDYTGIEAYPLSLVMIGQTGYNEYISEGVWQQFVANYNNLFLQPAQINPFCKLQIAHCELLNFQSKEHYDIVYFDAFAAAYQPEMWNEEAISHTMQFLKPGGVFVTYAITGNLKRMLKALNCKVEKVPGAPGKREMLRSTRF